MTTFRFRLSTLLKLREAARDERLNELAEARSLEARMQSRVEEVQAALQSTLSSRQQLTRPGTVKIEPLLDSEGFAWRLTLEQRSLDRQLQSIRDEVERRRQAVVEADREVRVLEKLRETQQERHTQEIHQREMAALDEIALRRFRGPEDTE